MTNIVQINQPVNEVTVNTYTGEAYISQRRAAELLGVARTSLQDFIHRPGNLEVSQGLSSEIFGNAVQYYALDARNTTSEAKELLRKITQAGAKAYLYHIAGYTINVQQITQPVSKKALLADIKLDAQIEASKAKIELYQMKVQAAKERDALKLQALKDKLAEQSKVLHARTTKLLSQGAKVKGDMVASKLDLPTDTITNLLKEHGSPIEPKLANWALRQLGYLTKTHEVTDTGHYYGRNIKSSPRSKTTLARWFPSEFDNLLDQIECTIEDLVNN